MFQYRSVAVVIDRSGQSLDFSERLRVAGLTKGEFRQLVYRLTGIVVPPTSVTRWVKGQHAPPATALALLELVSRLPPRLLADILTQYPESPLPSAPEDDADE